MQKGTRRILFWLAVLVFAGASYVAALFAQGYKYDFSAHAFVRTGAIAVTVNTDATLYLNDRLQGATAFLSHRAGVTRLLPGSYTVRVLRDGWSVWHKTASVKEGLLTDFPSVLLLPTAEEAQTVLRSEVEEDMKRSHALADPTSRPRQVVAGPFTLARLPAGRQGGTLTRTDKDPAVKVADGVLGLEKTDDSSRILWWTQNELWVLWLNGTDYQPFRTEGDKQLITRWSVPIVRAAWFRDRDHVAVDLGHGSYRIVETDTRGGINIIKI